ncbi:unnamed protein product [Phyllotreta striolata]|uniref:NADH dehydrogenase [ubiquinone] 1 beta subcomplex subunit 1 n=1 Tax=Phyllotreta striolata TaxID=444603 RepID=A0A9N9XNF9_PHYSR|nr:unnamed protein product [Phyllotreta striolata]
MYPIIPKKVYMMLFPFVGFALGTYLDRKETERLSFFRDKSALYGRTLKPGEPPSWP